MKQKRQMSPYPPRRSKAVFTDAELRKAAAKIAPAKLAIDWYEALREAVNALKPDASPSSLCTVQNRCWRAKPPIFAVRLRGAV